MKKIKSLNGLRGIAALIVLIAHWWASNPDYGIYASGCGKIGVWCFMLLSGFFLMYPFANRATLQFSISQYYLKKFLRIYPSYTLALVFAVVLGTLTWSDLYKHLLLYEGLGHFWYMPVIIKMYIIGPIFVLTYEFLDKKFKDTMVVNSIYGIGLLIVGTAFAVIFPVYTYEENSISLYWYIPVFMIGMILAMTYVSMQTKGINKCFAWDIICIVSVIAILVFTPFMRQALWGVEPSGWLQNKYLLMSGLWAFIILGLLFGKYIGELLEKCRFLQWIGNISFPVYLLHYLFLGKLNMYITNIWVKGVLLIIITLSISWMVNEMFEKKIMGKL